MPWAVGISRFGARIWKCISICTKRLGLRVVSYSAIKRTVLFGGPPPWIMGIVIAKLVLIVHLVVFWPLNLESLNLHSCSQ